MLNKASACWHPHLPGDRPSLQLRKFQPRDLPASAGPALPGATTLRAQVEGTDLPRGGPQESVVSPSKRNSRLSSSP